MRSVPTIVIIACAGLCLAVPVPNDVSKADEYDYTYPEDDESFVYQQMISPDWHTLPKELFGAEYVWDTKGFPKRVENLQEKPHSSSTIPQKHNTQRHKV